MASKLLQNASSGVKGCLRTIPSQDASTFRSSRGFSSHPGAPTSFKYKPPAYTGPSMEEVMKMRKEFLTPSLLTYYPNKPIMIVDGKMQYLFDQNGTPYLDMFAGIVTVSVGHCHPYVTEAAKKQMDKLQHTSTIYLNPNVAEFGKKLAATFPAESNLKVCYFVNSGSEANDLAMMMAREYTGNYDVIALRNGYHGAVGSAAGLTSLHTWKYRTPTDFGIKHALNPDPYRGLFRRGDPEIGKKYAAQVKDTIEFDSSGQVAAFIAEPIQGIGGAVELAEGYLPEVYKTVRQHGGLCISDEVQTGFGRTGTNYWGFQNSGVTPDIVVMAKGIGNGAPLAAVVTRPEIAQALTKRIHFNTYGGNPVSAAIGSAVLDVVKNENIQQKAHEIGTHLIQNLKQLQKKHPLIGDVRGRGLMLGVEFVRDQKTLEPANTETQAIIEKAREHGVLIGKGGLYGNCLRIKPPMCITKDNADYFTEVLDKCISDLKK
eukprot:TRINITY_DN982_c0_g1_i1.p1 TRINITY_DN982_c0_g1~~TRINITY_DN982_c0_g1_i1.p1  ORF type:complete len:487 (+),score=125.08 TRINITY_DN982_c0_g1_i1:17-1477(+)